MAGTAGARTGHRCSAVSSSHSGSSHPAGEGRRARRRGAPLHSPPCPAAHSCPDLVVASSAGATTLGSRQASGTAVGIARQTGTTLHAWASARSGGLQGGTGSWAGAHTALVDGVGWTRQGYGGAGQKVEREGLHQNPEVRGGTGWARVGWGAGARGSLTTVGLLPPEAQGAACLLAGAGIAAEDLTVHLLLEPGLVGAAQSQNAVPGGHMWQNLIREQTQL